VNVLPFSKSQHGDETRVPPRSLESEQALLGSILINNDVMGRVASIVLPDHFHEALHRHIFEVLTTMIAEGKVANAITAKPFVKMPDGGVSAIQYLAGLTGSACTISSAKTNAEIIRDCAIRRRLITMAEEIRDEAYQASVQRPALKMLDEFEEGLAELRPASSAGGASFTAYEDIGTEEIYEAYRSQHKLIGISSGFPAIDDAIGGLQKTDLIIIAGRPGSGKTSLAENIARHVALGIQAKRDAGEKRGVVAFSSLEMGKSQLKYRGVADLANVPLWKLRRGIASDDEIQRFADADHSFSRLPLSIDASSGITVAQLGMRARALKKNRGLELLVIDYLGLMQGSRKGMTEYDVVTEVSGGLKTLAKDLEVPVIALCQLSRKVDERPDRRPQLADLRSSGAIEQDADIVAFVYREEYYLQKEEPREGTEAHIEWERQMDRVRGCADVIIGKNRHGPERTIRMGFEGQFTRFLNAPPYREDEPAQEDRRRATKKKFTPPKGVTKAWGILKTLSMTRSLETLGELDKVPRGVRAVEYSLWKEKVCEELLDPEATDAQKIAEMKIVVKALSDEGMIGRSGKDRPLVWLTEKGAA
jgi:replicative DNA helicase